MTSLGTYSWKKGVLQHALGAPMLPMIQMFSLPQQHALGWSIMNKTLPVYSKFTHPTLSDNADITDFFGSILDVCSYL